MDLEVWGGVEILHVPAEARAERRCGDGLQALREDCSVNNVRNWHITDRLITLGQAHGRSYEVRQAPSVRERAVDTTKASTVAQDQV